MVSGLALGIDGAAHAGALGGRGGAADRRGRQRARPHLPARSTARSGARSPAPGVVLSEYPLGAPAAAWHFPARNRLIAALADVVVVVESQATGGAMRTAVEAARRGRARAGRARPGHRRQLRRHQPAPVRRLLAAPATPTTCCSPSAASPARIRRPRERRPKPAGDAETVLGHTPWGPVVARARSPWPPASTWVGWPLALDRLDADGWIARRGGWFERLGRPAGAR